MRLTNTRIIQLQALIVVLLLTLGFIAGYSWPRADVAAYERGRNQREVEIAHCSLEDARAERCYIPCTTDSDCLAKNGMTDH